MIATVTLNPSVDICYYLDYIKINEVNRTEKYYKTAGGKGINVSKVLKQLGSEVIATGFLGGGTGSFIEKELERMSIIPRFVQIAEGTRNCIAIIDNLGQQTELLETGPNITKQESDIFIEVVTDILNSNIKVIAASGSIPRGLTKNYYSLIIEEAKKRGIKFVLDTSGDTLREAIKSAPYLIKPNITELERLLDIKIQCEQELISAMRQLKAYNIEMIVVSQGEGGCIGLCGHELYKVTIPKVNVKSAVGSGDAMLAGMISEIHNGSSCEEILKVGSVCGILNAMNDKTGNIDTTNFEEIYSKIVVNKLE